VSRGRSQAECCREWRTRGAAITARAQRLQSVAASALTRPRLDGGWSAAQVLEHLVLASETYLAVMRQRVEAYAAPGGGDALVWRPRLGGRLLVRSMKSPRPLPAPRGFRPGAAPRPQVVETFIEEMRELDAVLTRAEAVPWNRIRFGSPVVAVLRLNFGDGCLILLTHAERHFGQIDRALAEAGQAAPAQLS
jgi:hypothetical protein